MCVCVCLSVCLYLCVVVVVVYRKIPGIREVRKPPKGSFKVNHFKSSSEICACMCVCVCVCVRHFINNLSLSKSGIKLKRELGNPTNESNTLSTELCITEA